MAEKLMYISNNDIEKPYCRLHLMVSIWTINLMNQQIKIHKSLQSCYANKSENVIIKLWGLRSQSFGTPILRVMGGEEG